MRPASSSQVHPDKGHHDVSAADTRGQQTSDPTTTEAGCSEARLSWPLQAASSTSSSQLLMHSSSQRLANLLLRSISCGGAQPPSPAPAAARVPAELEASPCGAVAMRRRCSMVQESAHECSAPSSCEDLQRLGSSSLRTPRVADAAPQQCCAAAPFEGSAAPLPAIRLSGQRRTSSAEGPGGVSPRTPTRRPPQIAVDPSMLESGEWSSPSVWRRSEVGAPPAAADGSTPSSGCSAAAVVVVPPELRQLPCGSLVKGRELGRGHFGHVWLATWHGEGGDASGGGSGGAGSVCGSSGSSAGSDGACSSSREGAARALRVAVKELMPSGGSGLTSADVDAAAWSPQQLLAEGQRLHELRHPHVVSLLGVVAEPETGTYALVTEYMASGCLKGALQRVHTRHGAAGVGLRWKAAVARAAALGMAHLHASGVVHHDLKPENLLCDLESDAENPAVKIGDLGLSQRRSGAHVPGSMRGTLSYLAPELFGSRCEAGSGCAGCAGCAAAVAAGEGMVTDAVDVYAFGVCMLEIWGLCQRAAYQGMASSEVKAGLMTGSLRPEVPAGMEPAWAKLMQRCWAACPSARPSFEQVARELGEIMQQQQP